MDFIYEGLAGLEGISPYVYLVVFLGGVVSAVSICYVPSLVMFSSYIGSRADEGTGKAVAFTANFTLGMMVTSAVAGAVAAYIGNAIMLLFTGYHLDIWIPATIGIVMGLQLLGWIKLKMPRQLQVKGKKPKTMMGAFTFGLPFGLVITPCTIPIFIMLITYIAVQGSVIHGALLLAVYALGKGFVLGIVATSSVAFLKDFMQKWGAKVEKITGIVLILVSLYLIFFQVEMGIPDIP
jgi:cytochrome c-type biogenesis protein